MIKMIIATGINGEIGFNNQLLWNIPEDLKYFSTQTRGSAVIMGNTTYKSLPFSNGLPKRYNIVLSSVVRESSWMHFDTPAIVSDIEWLRKEGLLSLETMGVDVWIIGGASVYEQFKDLVEEVHWTQVNCTYPYADTYFDMKWVSDESKYYLDHEEDLNYMSKVCVYKRFY